MKVKNGMASSVSFDMTPQNALRQRVEQRPGQRDRAVGIGRQLDADEEEEQAVGGEREGDRIAEQQEDDRATANMIGAMFCGDELDHVRELLGAAPWPRARPASWAEMNGRAGRPCRRA